MRTTKTKNYSTMKTKLMLALLLVSGVAFAQPTVKGENDPTIFKEVRTFLNALNNSGGKPLETLSPADARPGARRRSEIGSRRLLRHRRV